MSENSATVLVVDDEQSIRNSLRTILSGLGFSVVEAARGEEALALVRTAQFDAVLLDIQMPGIGGVEVCSRIRGISPSLPVLMVTVEASEDRKVAALNAGADDFITKPFQLRELIARLRAAIRRNEPAQAVGPSVTVGEVTLDPERHAVLKRGRRIHLTPKEFELLHFFMLNAGRPIPHAQVLRSVWGREHSDALEYLRTFIRQLRMKIEDDPANPRYLLTESHIGYRFSEYI